MATLLFTAVGTALAGPLGGALGALAGRQVDALVFGGGTREGPRLSDLSVTTSSFGTPIGRQFGRMRVAGQIIWSTDLVEHRDSQSNGKGQPSTVTYSYTVSFAVALSSRPIADVGRVWADGNLLRGAGGDLKVGGSFRLYTGHGDQPVDPLMASAEAAGQCPAYRGTAYAVFENLQLADYGNRIPALTFEVLADSAPLQLADLLGTVITDVDAELPLPELAGITNDGPLGDMITALTPLFPLDCDACDADLVFGPDRLQAAPIALNEAAIGSGQGAFGGNAGYQIKRTAPTETPLAVLRYYDVDRDYQPGVQRASGQPAPGQPRTIELPAALTATDALGLIERAAKRLVWSRETLAWRVTELDPAVRPGAAVTVPGHPGVWRVTSWEWRDSGVDLGLARLAPALWNPQAVALAGRASTAVDVPVQPTDLVAYELPWDGNPATPIPLVIAAASASRAGWGGASLMVDQGDGALIPAGSSGRDRAVVGTAAAPLLSASPLLFDRANVLSVRLDGVDMALTSATMRQLAMGANRALIGTEIIQFANAQAAADGSWQLSGLLRGRGGTEAAVAGHAAGERFVLLDGTGATLDPSLLVNSPALRVAALGLGDSTPVFAAVALQGIGFRPPSPVHGALVENGDGSWTLSWVRRARGAWLWPDQADTPLAEQSEVYDVVFAEGASEITRWAVAVPQLTLSAADMTALRAAAPAGSFAVRQRGDRASSDSLMLPLPA